MAGSLRGKRILVTRAAEQAESFSAKIRARGGQPVEIPVLAFRRPEDPSEIETALQYLQDYRWVVFTSANGVRYFFQILREAGFDYPVGVKTAVVGQKTFRALQKYGVNADLIPEQFVAESLLERLKSEVRSGDAVLMPRGNLARKKLSEELSEFGANVTDLVVYETVVNRDGGKTLNTLLKDRRLDMVTFTSSSTVKYFLELLEERGGRKYLDDVKIACIGPITAKTANEHGLAPGIIADQYTVDGLLDAIEQFYGEDAK
jgi:uroporphyrinogen-III synthase